MEAVSLGIPERWGRIGLRILLLEDAEAQAPFECQLYQLLIEFKTTDFKYFCVPSCAAGIGHVQTKASSLVKEEEPW